ncbi:DNA-3-methyladenine glycosylase family protein [Nitrosovibrio tenuis]|uniref:DNA-3-methyladenine glycosylase II n=1 Tax=Nitrosovibrio tenuis TaxID=1233 RepID=A0A1H7G2K6_9PROT|nr:DNA-3-methyladenine glycosylase [Nitrosovibrio tenuis]SEK31022.1 DNA-3-methyladenine glycosylase II [Nitrosovibrio tenuis]
MIPPYWEQATHELAASDEVMQKLILRFEGVLLHSRGDAFGTLARSILGQQISVKAAESIWQKLSNAIGDITPHAILDAEHGTLRDCGLSLRKMGYIQELSRHFVDGTLNAAAWNEMDDEALIDKLTRIKGIGRWTAEMFLIFHMLRPDVLPMDDLGLQRALSMHYNANQPVSRLKMRAIAKPWQPWRSVATWYLWRSLEPVPVEY